VFAFARTTLANPHFRQGAADMAPTAAGIAAWGLVTGVAMVKSGLSVPVALAMSLLVFAGSSQLAALPLIAAGAPMWLIWATAFCVNLRFLIFSAQWRPFWIHLPFWHRLRIGYWCADFNYVFFMQRFSSAPDAIRADRAAHQPYFWGTVAVNGTAWQVPSILGILLAHSVPTAWGLGFAGTLALLGMTYSLLANRAAWAAAAVAGLAAVAAFALPLRLNLVVAIAAAVALGLFMDSGGADGMKRLARRWGLKRADPSHTQARAGAGREVSA
jgi:predicted branched-subunit amino acid permease